MVVFVTDYIHSVQSASQAIPPSQALGLPRFVIDAHQTGTPFNELYRRTHHSLIHDTIEVGQRACDGGLAVTAD